MVVGLPRGASAKVTLQGPGASRLAVGSSRSLCLTAEGSYALVALPVDLGRFEVAYPSEPVGAVAGERIAFSVPPDRPRTLRVGYFDVAPRSTVILPPGTIATPSGRAPASFGTFALHPRRGAAAAVASLKAGDILVQPVTGGRAQGVLARVTAVTRSAGGTDVTTSKVSPFAAFRRLRLQAHLAHAREALTLPPSPTVRRPGAADEGGPGITCSVLDVTPSLSVAPSATLTIGISDPDLFNPQVNGSFSLSPNLSGSLTFASTAGFDCSASASLDPVPIGDFCTEIGCFTVNLLAEAQAGGSVGEAFSETIGDTLSGSAGASFTFGATTPSFSTFDHLHLVPTASQQPPGWQGSISAGVGPAIQVLYGIPDVGGVGPQLGLLDEISLSGNASGWSLNGGVTGTAGIALDALGYSFEQGVDFSLGSATLLSGSWNPSPTVPLDPTVTGAGATSLTVSWQKPAWPGASGLSGYTITATPAGAASPQVTTTAPASATSAPIDNLSGSTSYTLTITATSNGSPGPAATIAGTTEAPTPPGPPDLTGVNNGGGCGSGAAPVVTVTALPPQSDGGSAIASYTITWSGNGTSGVVQVPASQLGINTVTLPAYTSQPYSFTVTATNAAGTGPPSQVVTATCVSTPGPPPGLVATAGALDVKGAVQPGATVSWAPAAPHGAPVTSYTVAWAGGGKSGSASVDEPTSGGPVTKATIALPSYGTAYDLSVSGANAVTGVGGLQPEESQTTVTPVTFPNAPTSVTASGSAGRIDVSWAAPAFDGGSPITRYEVAWVGAGERQVVDAGAATSASFSIPEGGVPYHLVVLADNAAGLSPPSAEVTVTPSGPPGPPAGLTLVSVKGLEDTYQASWSAPADQGGAPVSGYRYCWSAGAQRTCGRLGADRTTLPIAISSPSGNDLRLALAVSVRAFNSFGTGLPATVELTVSGNPLPGPGPGPGRKP